ncbi:MAG: hypothetical protein WD118_06785 [Phycisphaeraceae bacterium]
MDTDNLNAELEAEIEQILAAATGPLSVAEIYAHSALAEGRHTLAARVGSMAKRGQVIHSHSYGENHRYRLPEPEPEPEPEPVAAAAKPVARPHAKSLKRQVQAHLEAVGKPLTLRQIADNLHQERPVITRALNALGRDGMVSKQPLDGNRRRMAWSAQPSGLDEALAMPPVHQSVPSLRCRSTMTPVTAAASPAPAEAGRPVYSLASDGSLTLHLVRDELTLDAEQTEALLDYLAPWVLRRERGQAQEVAA